MLSASSSEVDPGTAGLTSIFASASFYLSLYYSRREGGLLGTLCIEVRGLYSGVNESRVPARLILKFQKSADLVEMCHILAMSTNK